MKCWAGWSTSWNHVCQEKYHNLRYADNTTLMAKSEDEQKSLWWKWKEESEKAGLKLNIQETKIVSSGPITSWQKNVETMETTTDFIFLGSKLTADGNCSHEIKRLLLLGRKKYIHDKPRQHVKKQRHHFADKGPSSQNYDFSSSHVWMWELDHKESWVPKNWCFWLVVLEKTLESPLDCKEIQPVNPEYSLEGLMVKLKLQYFGHFHQSIGEGLTHWKRPWCWERLKAGGERDDRGWDSWMAVWVASQTRQTWVWVSSGSWW